MEDSLEMVSNGYWTTRFSAEFLRRCGYSVASILRIILQKSSKYLFVFSDADLTRGARNNYWDTISDLYVDYHIKPLKSWATAKGLKYRVQTYGGELVLLLTRHVNMIDLCYVDDSSANSIL